MKKLLILLVLVLAAFLGYRAYEKANALSPEQEQVAALVAQMDRIEQSAGQAAKAGALSGLDTGSSWDKDQADAEALQKQLATLQAGLKDAKARSTATQLEGRVEAFIRRMKK